MEDASNFTSKIELKNRIAEWKEENVPIPDILDFYSLDAIKHKPLDRPYTWSNTIGSLDGVIAFQDREFTGPEEIALKHIKNSGGGSDWRLLNAGWMLADAVMISGAILRAEPNICTIPHFEDLLECRVKQLNKKTKYPIAVIITGTGQIDLKHLTFNKSDVSVVILTTKKGDQLIKNQNGSNIPSHIHIETVEGKDGNVDLEEAFKLLHHKYNINYLDICAGGKTIASLTKLNLLDEFRLTVAGQLIGLLNTQKEIRPTVFQLPEGQTYLPNDNPLVRYDGIRLFGHHHLFIRGTIIYRNDTKNQ